MASKIAVIKLLEEKTQSRVSELEERYKNALAETNKRISGRTEELAVAFKKHLALTPMAMEVPNQDKRRKPLSITFSLSDYFDGTYNRATPMAVMEADPIYMELHKEKATLIQERDGKINALKLKARSIKEAIILSGIPDNIRELMSEFDGAAS